MLKFRTRLLAALLALAMVAGSASFAQTTLRFTIWSGNQAHIDMLNGFAESFREIRPDVNVRLDIIPFAEYVQKITLQLAGGNPPDIGWLAEASAPTFVDAGVLADLGPTLRSDPEYDFADFSTSALGLWVENGAVYGVPFSTSPFIIYYNTDLFAAAGLETPDVLAERGEWTWETFRAASQAIAEATPAGTYGFEQSDGEGYDARIWVTITPMLRSFGGDAWDADDTCVLTAPESIEAMELYHAMIFEDRSIVPPGERADFFSGRSGMTMTQLSRAASLVDATFEWGIAPLPTGAAGDTAVVGQAGVVVFNNAPNRDIAIEFARHVTNQQNVATMAQFFPPARLSVLDSDDFLTSNAIVSPEDMAVIADGIARGSVIPSHPMFPQIDATARPIFDAMWRADADVPAVLARICEAITPLLGQR